MPFFIFDVAVDISSSPSAYFAYCNNSIYLPNHLLFTSFALECDLVHYIIHSPSSSSPGVPRLPLLLCIYPPSKSAFFLSSAELGFDIVAGKLTTCCINFHRQWSGRWRRMPPIEFTIIIVNNQLHKRAFHSHLSLPPTPSSSSITASTSVQCRIVCLYKLLPFLQFPYSRPRILLFTVVFFFFIIIFVFFNYIQVRVNRIPGHSQHKLITEQLAGQL